MGQVMVDLGGPEQRLGRDAAPVEADAAELLALDDGGLEAELRRPDSRDIAAGPRTEDDEIVAVRHGGPSCCCGSVQTPKRGLGATAHNQMTRQGQEPRGAAVCLIEV